MSTLPIVPITSFYPTPLRSEISNKRGSCLDMTLTPQTNAAPQLSPVDAPRQAAKKNRANQPTYPRSLSQSLINATHEAKVANCDKYEDVVDEGSDNELNALVHLIRI